MRTNKIIRIVLCIFMVSLVCLEIVGCSFETNNESQKQEVYKAIVPQDVTVKLEKTVNSLGSTYYSYRLEYDENGVGSINFHTKSSYAYEFVHDYRNRFVSSGAENIMREFLDDTGKRIVYYDYGGTQKYADIRGTLLRGEETIIINKRYDLARGQTTIDEAVDIPAYVTMYCRQGDIYYIVKLSGFSEVKADAWFLSLGLDLSSVGNK